MRRLALLSTPVVSGSRMFGRLADFDVIELSLFLNEKEASFLVIDCLKAHPQTIVRHATGASSGPPR